jgi:TPR repeat protein
MSHSTQEQGAQVQSVNKKKGDKEYELGEKYYNGKGAPQSYERAVEWYRKAAAQGNENAKKALQKLGLYYNNGCHQLYRRQVITACRRFF